MLNTSGADASITSPSGAITAASGSPPSVPFTISFDKHSHVGAAWLQVVIIDAANHTLVYDTETLNVTVNKQPGWLAQHLWEIIAAMALIILVILALLWRRAVIRRRKDVRGLVAILRRNGEQLGRELVAPNRWSDVFRFMIRDETEPTARLDFPQPGFSEYQVRRSRPNEVKLMTPVGGEPYDVVVGGPAETIDHSGLELAFRDTRRPQGGGRGPGRSTPRPRPAPVPEPLGPSTTGTGLPGPESPKDEWL
jgi:membrane protein implicated in regulation of membrane protease activity